MANEFGGLVLPCVGTDLVPYGPSYTSAAHRACTVKGASADGTYILGGDYTEAAYSYSPSHVWRNFGICCAWWVLFTFLMALAMERAGAVSSGKSSLVYKRGKKTKHATVALKRAGDEERGVPASSGSSSSSVAKVQQDNLNLAINESVFTWDHLCYTVDVPGGKRQLLDDITGWVKPGQLGALMGSSGAGKTTLLDVLAQRKDTGVITGEVLVDGRPLPVSFQRSTGYCEQMDVHEGTSTVREALIFSARLRQPKETPDEEKIAYIDSIIKLLELEDIQDALIGVPGAGLTVEQRKRLTIGVELAAKPSILLFLDEPTSGLDGQSSFNIVRFLRRLTAAGQAVLCTIHQPSASLFESFDSLLLLAKGGKTVYFGETGENSQILLEYFAKNGAPCNEDVNPAEHIIDVVSGSTGGGRDWHDIWKASPEHTRVREQLEELKSEALSKPSPLKIDDADFATPFWTQLKLVLERQQVALWRNPAYIWNKFILHIISALFAGFTFWKLGNSSSDMMTRVLAVFNFLFVALGVIAQMQPLFMHYRDIFEAREKKSKMYGWVAFVAAQMVAEMPYLVVCGTLYFVCWYYTVGLPNKASTAGQVYFQMLLFEFLYTAIGQGIAAISPNPFFASLLNPVILGSFLINFAGVLVPYAQINVFWRYWMYYLDPYNYLVGGLVTQILYDVEITCSAKDLTRFSPPEGQTCGQYLADFLEMAPGYLVDANATGTCEYCPFSNGGEYAQGLNLLSRMYAWRDTGITALFVVATYGFVFLCMKVRSKKTKSAKAD
jgi:ABC-type multidrug transport system ATPase subunit/ABC-type multidrug transport system permease subunit